MGAEPAYVNCLMNAHHVHYYHYCYQYMRVRSTRISGIADCGFLEAGIAPCISLYIRQSSTARIGKFGERDERKEDLPKGQALA